MRLLGYGLLVLTWGSATIWWYEMVRDVNRKLPEDKRFSFFGGGSPGRLVEIWRTHTRLYPHSKVRLAHLLSMLGIAVVFFLFASRI